MRALTRRGNCFEPLPGSVPSHVVAVLRSALFYWKGGGGNGGEEGGWVEVNKFPSAGNEIGTLACVCVRERERERSCVERKRARACV